MKYTDVRKFTKQVYIMVGRPTMLFILLIYSVVFSRQIFNRISASQNVTCYGWLSRMNKRKIINVYKWNLICFCYGWLSRVNKGKIINVYKYRILYVFVMDNFPEWIKERISMYTSIESCMFLLYVNFNMSFIHSYKYDLTKFQKYCSKQFCKRLNEIILVFFYLFFF